MIEFLLNPLQYNFFLTAVLTGSILGLIAPILGSFIVVSRQSVISDMLAHTALAGVGLGVLIGVSPSLGSIFAVIVSAIVLWVLQKNNHNPESISMVLLTGGLSLAILFIHLSPQTTVNLENYLFGSILTITQQDFYIISIALFLLAMIMLFQWNNLTRLVFSPEYYKSTSHTKSRIELMFLIMVAILVGVSLKTIGGLLIGGLFIIPVLASQNISSSFKQTCFKAALLGVTSVLIGLYSSYYLNLPTSSCIILTSIFFFLASHISQFKSN